MANREGAPTHADRQLGELARLPRSNCVTVPARSADDANGLVAGPEPEVGPSSSRPAAYAEMTRDAASGVVWVAHPDRLVADSLVAVLGRRSSFARAYRCSSPSELTRVSVEELPDLFLVDEALAQGLVPAVSALPPDRVRSMAIVVLAATVDDDLVRLALALPADGVLLKSLSADDAIAALKHVDSGQGVFPLGWSQAVAAALQVQERSCVGLTMRELQVLDLVAAGLSNAEVATRLFVTTHTVKFHLRRIYAKLEVRNRVEAVGLMRSPVDGFDGEALGPSGEAASSRSSRSQPAGRGVVRTTKRP